MIRLNQKAQRAQIDKRAREKKKFLDRIYEDKWTASNKSA